MYSLLTALKRTQSKSVLGLKAALSSKRSSVTQLLQTHLIHERYTKFGQSKGPFGFPVGEVQFVGKKAVRHYRGGDIDVGAVDSGAKPMEAGGLPVWEITVTYGGFKCLEESSSDQLSDTDEPYFIVSVWNAGKIPVTKKLGPYENIAKGDSKSVPQPLGGKLSPDPLFIHVAAFEHDFGDPDDIEKAIQDKLVELAKAAEALAAGLGADAADGGGIGPAAGAGTVSGLMASPIVGAVVFGIVAIMDLGDDYISEGGLDAFTHPDEVTEASVHLPKIGDFGTMDNGYNKKIEIDGGDEGKYELYFDIHATKWVPSKG